MSAEVIDLISSDEDEDINSDIEINDMEKNSNNNNFNNKNNSSTFTNGSSKTIEIKVRRSDNASDIIMNISPYETCGTLKKRIFEKEMIDPERQRIMFAGKEIRNNSTLKDYNVLDGYVVQLLITPQVMNQSSNKQKRKRDAITPVISVPQEANTRRRVDPNDNNNTRNNNNRINPHDVIEIADSSEEEEEEEDDSSDSYNDDDAGDDAAIDNNNYDNNNGVKKKTPLIRDFKICCEMVQKVVPDKYRQTLTSYKKWIAMKKDNNQGLTNGEVHGLSRDPKSIFHDEWDHKVYLGIPCGLKKKKKNSTSTSNYNSNGNQSFDDDMESITLPDEYDHINLPDCDVQLYQKIAPQYHEMIISLLDNNDKDLERAMDQLSRLTRCEPPQLPDVDLLKRLFEWASGIKQKEPPRTPSVWIFLNDIIIRFPCYFTNVDFNRANVIDQMLYKLINYLKPSDEGRIMSEKNIDVYCRKIIHAFDFVNILLEKDFIVAKHKNKLKSSDWYQCKQEKHISKFNKDISYRGKFANTELIGHAFKQFWERLYDKDDACGEKLQKTILNPRFNCFMSVHKTLCTLSYLITQKKTKECLLKPLCRFMKKLEEEAPAKPKSSREERKEPLHAITKLIKKMSSPQIRKDMKLISEKVRGFELTSIEELKVVPFSPFVSNDQVSSSFVEKDTMSNNKVHDDDDEELTGKITELIQAKAIQDKQIGKQPRNGYYVEHENDDILPITGFMDYDFPPTPQQSSSFFNARVPCKRVKNSKKGIGPFNHNVNEKKRKSQLIVQAAHAEGLLPWRDDSGKLKFLSPNVRYSIRRSQSANSNNDEEKLLKYAQIYRKILRKFWEELFVEHNSNNTNSRGRSNSVDNITNQTIPSDLLISKLKNIILLNKELEKKTMAKTLGMTSKARDLVVADIKKDNLQTEKSDVNYEEFVWKMEETCGKQVGDTMLQYVKNGGEVNDFNF